MKCCDIFPGMLRHTVVFLSQETVSIGGGATEVQYVPFATVKGFFRSLSGNERLRSERIDAETKNRLIVRYRDDLTESNIVKFRDRYYDIRFINNIEFRDRWIEIDLDGGQALQGIEEATT